MKLLTFSLLFGSLSFPSIGLAQESFQDVTSSFVESKDWLGLRVYIKKKLRGKNKLTPKSWRTLYETILRNPQIGYDFAYNIGSLNPNEDTDVVSKTLDLAEELLLAGNAQEALNNYQRVAKSIRSRINPLKAKLLADERSREKGLKSQQIRAIEKEIRILEEVYPFALHGMARSLYTLRSFQESYKVYSWIPLFYPRLQQTFFERTWSAFMSGDIANALGSIASQRSGFFGRLINTESFILEVYIYRRLCRYDSVRSVLDEMKSIQDGFRNKSITWYEWAQRDTYSLALRNLTDKKQESSASPEHVTAQEKEAERQRLTRILSNRFEREKAAYLKSLDLAISYSTLAMINQDSKLLKPVKNLGTRIDYLNSQKEIWPAEKGETWIDEMGRQIYGGDSLCATSNN
jgi:hypothetical protein